MAIIENIYHQPMMFNPQLKKQDYGFIVNEKIKKIDSFPQIFLASGEPWFVANRYAFFRYYESQKDLKTVRNDLSHLARYASWLESVGLDWLHFPKRKAERCLFRFRGYLIELRYEGMLAPSTITEGMNVVVAFYRWASVNGFTAERPSLFDNKIKTISFFDKVGFNRTLSVTSSELAIPNRVREGVKLEDGLTPISQVSTKILMGFLSKHKNYELYLIMKVALQTGCRFESITTLNITALKNYYPDQALRSVMKVKIGPGTGVETKFDVSGSVYFPLSLINELFDYFNSAEAILRRSKAKHELQKNIFITSMGNRYSRQTFGTLLHRLKMELIEDGSTEFGRFKFHQLRATFCTMLMRSVLNTEGVSTLNAIELVKDAMLHKDASVTWKYIKFLEREPIEAKFLETLWSMFTGDTNNADNIIEGLISGEKINV